LLLKFQVENGTLHQPWFDVNRFEGQVMPVPNGGLSLPGTVKWFFTKGGAFEFTTIYMQLRSRITGDSLIPEEDALPLYQPLAESSSTHHPSTTDPEEPPHYPSS
jgi:hypothetical protein